MIISDASIASNAELIKFTKITHIINLSTKKVDNFFAEKQRDKEIVKKLFSESEDSEYNDLIGKVKYFSVDDWNESNIKLTFDLCQELYMFIEKAVRTKSICLVISLKNYCSTVAVACAYLIFKHKWSSQSALEYIKGIKVDVNMTPGILTQLTKIETHFLQMIRISNKRLTLRSNWRIT